MWGDVFPGEWPSGWQTTGTQAPSRCHSFISKWSRVVRQAPSQAFNMTITFPIQRLCPSQRKAGKDRMSRGNPKWVLSVYLKFKLQPASCSCPVLCDHRHHESFEEETDTSVEVLPFPASLLASVNCGFTVLVLPLINKQWQSLLDTVDESPMRIRYIQKHLVCPLFIEFIKWVKLRE